MSGASNARVSSGETLRELVHEANTLAKSRGQVLALAHVYVLVLAALERANVAHRRARERIEEEILPQLDRRQRGYGDRDDVATFAWQDADRSYRQYLAALAEPALPWPASVLAWLLDVAFEDPSQKWCREACRRAGIVGSNAKNDATLPELGFGRAFTGALAQRGANEPLLGRDSELAKHLGFLLLALQQRSHYLLVGKSGVGKSFFLRHLLLRAQEQPAPRRFVLFDRSDFLGSESENRERFGRLYAYLQQHPDCVPAFDGLEHVLRHAPNLSEHFAALFGGLLAGGGRTFVLVCESSVASATPILKGIRACPLPPLVASSTRQLLLELTLPRLCGEADLTPRPSPEALADALLDAATQRYLGRFLPEVVLHIAESAVGRAKNRSTFLAQPPLGTLTIEDVWSHVVDEQGLSPELFGKDPRQFYRNLRERLSARIIGQEHAARRVSAVLEMHSERPPQRAPRGRFLFVGPPGVGKTELGRALAQELGFGEEAFFVFNMSEYSSQSARTRFMGADPGYVGFNTTRTLYQCVRERPACVVLLDEIDRADASIQDILLSILEGEGKDAEGQPVYFSQAVFVLTTNLGQEAVQAAYEAVVRGELSREQLVERFADERLRALVLEGASDEAEMAMRASVDTLIARTKADIQVSPSAELGEHLQVEQIMRYTNLKELRARLDRSVRTSPLDRALLDRIDFIIPFFPIKERALLERILELKLDAYGWRDCAPQTRAEILDSALAQRESVRPLERLIKKHLCAESS